MGQASAKLRRTTNGWAHWCSACEEMHVYQVGVKDRPNWTFDGNLDAPSFSPSMLIRWGRKVPGYENHPDMDAGGVCHYFLTAGRIAFCGDSTHSLAGKTIDLPDLPPALRDVDPLLASSGDIGT